MKIMFSTLRIIFVLSVRVIEINMIIADSLTRVVFFQEKAATN